MNVNKEQLSAALARLHDLIETLERAWSETCAHWDDDTKRHFEEFRLRPLLNDLKGVLEATVPVRECFARADACAHHAMNATVPIGSPECRREHYDPWSIS